MQTIIQHSPVFTTTWTSTCTGDFAVSTQPVMPYHETPAAEKAPNPFREGELTESAQTLACDPLPDFWPGQETFADFAPVATEFVVETADGLGVLVVGNTVLVGTPKAGKSSCIYGGLIAGLTKVGGAFRIRGSEGDLAAVLVTAQEDPSGQICAQILASDGNTRLVSFIDPAKACVASSDPIGDYLNEVDQRLTKCPKCKLVVTDTLAKLATTLGFSMSSSREIRRLLDGTQRLGEKHKVAFLWTHHFTKDDAQKTLSAKIAGSNQILATVRAMWVLGTHPQDPQVRGLAYYQGNLLPELLTLAFRLTKVPYSQVYSAALRNHSQGSPFTKPPEEAKYMQVEFMAHEPFSAEDLTRKPARKAKVEADQPGADWYGDMDEDEVNGDESRADEPSVESHQAHLPVAPPTPMVPVVVGQVGTKAPNRRDKNAPKVAAALIAQILARFKASPETVLTSKEVKAAMQNAGLKKSWYPKLSRRLQEEGLEFGKCRHEGTMCTIWLKPTPDHGPKPSTPHMALPPSSGTMAVMDLGYGPVTYIA